MSIEEIVTAAVVAFVGILVIFTIFTGIVMAKAKADCLAEGFPRYSVTWDFKTYCIGYDGAIHPVVKEQK